MAFLAVPKLWVGGDRRKEEFCLRHRRTARMVEIRQRSNGNQVDLIDGSNGGGNGNGGGGGGGGGSDGGENEYDEKEFGPLLKFEEVMREAEARGVDLPADMLEEAKSFGIRKLMLLRYLDLQGSSGLLGFAMKAFPMLHNRMLADPSFLFKAVTEIVIDSCCATFAEVQKRGKDFWNEFKIYAADLLVGVAVNVAFGARYNGGCGGETFGARYNGGCGGETFGARGNRRNRGDDGYCRVRKEDPLHNNDQSNQVLVSEPLNKVWDYISGKWKKDLQYQADAWEIQPNFASFSLPQPQLMIGVAHILSNKKPALRSSQLALPRPERTYPRLAMQKRAQCSGDDKGEDWKSYSTQMEELLRLRQEVGMMREMMQFEAEVDADMKVLGPNLRELYDRLTKMHDRHVIRRAATSLASEWDNIHVPSAKEMSLFTPHDYLGRIQVQLLRVMKIGFGIQGPED